jgi:hypothetical protein
MLLAVGVQQTLGVDSGARLRFGEELKQPGAWAGRRLMWLDDKAAFELSFWCGTCQFLFKRLEGSNSTMSLAEVAEQLTSGIETVDNDIVARFASLLPAGGYLPMLLHLRPRLVYPSGPGDYFAEEQVATWGVDSFWGLPGYPQTPYYRAHEATIDDGAHFFEFVVPMVPPSWNDSTRVEERRRRLASSSRPTAVAVSVLDVCQPANKSGPDYFAHWALTHFVLDGHHKLQAAAETGKPMQLLSLASVDASLAVIDQFARLPEILRRPYAQREVRPR